MTRDDRPTKVPEALDALNHLYKKMVDDVNVGDRTYNEGVLKMVKSYDRNSMMTNASSMHCFSKSFESSVSRGANLKVQPTSVSRRTFRNGSRNKQDTKKKNELPHRPVYAKRDHNASEAIEMRQPFAKGHGNSMSSFCKYQKRGKDI